MRYRILIADDEPNIVVSLEYMIEREGHEAIIARDGPEALAMIERERPDLVLLDAMMPGMSGFDVCQAVRANDALRDTKILMVTAKGREADQAKALGVGVDGYLTKPFSMRHLLQRMQELLARRE